LDSLILKKNDGKYFFVNFVQSNFIYLKKIIIKNIDFYFFIIFLRGQSSNCQQYQAYTQQGEMAFKKCGVTEGGNTSTQKKIIT
jgi:hypothetical protein